MKQTAADAKTIEALDKYLYTLRNFKANPPESVRVTSQQLAALKRKHGGQPVTQYKGFELTQHKKEI